MSNKAEGDFMLIITPLLLSLFSSAVTGSVKYSGYNKAWFEPPGYVFGIVWTALYIMFGFLLYEAKRTSDWTMLGLVIGTLFLTYSWQYYFVKMRNYKFSMIILLATLIMGFEIYSQLILENWENYYLFTFVPFLGWIIFALLLAAFSGLEYDNPRLKNE